MKLERAALDSDADTLLIVENDTALLAQLRRAMEARGFAVRTATTESEAIELSREYQPRYALVDLRLEPGDGLAVVTALHQMNPACRSVIFSGYGNIPTAVSAVKAGAIDYLPKPADPDEIADALRAPVGGAAKPPEHPPSPNAVRRQHILNVFAECSHNVSVTARRLGMHRRTLKRLLARETDSRPADEIQIVNPPLRQSPEPVLHRQVCDAAERGQPMNASALQRRWDQKLSIGTLAKSFPSQPMNPDP